MLSLRVRLPSAEAQANYRNAVMEGALVVAAINVVGTFVPVFALSLGAGRTAVGLVISLPFLCNAVALLISERFTRGRTELMRPMVWTGFLHRAFMALLVAAPWLGEYKVAWVIACFSLSSAMIAVSAAHWTVVVSDMFPRAVRGEVFGTRMMLTGLAGLAATLIAGQVLDWLPFPLNYQVTFAVCAAMGWWALRYLWRLRAPAQTEPIVPDAAHGESPARDTAAKPSTEREGVAFVRLAGAAFLFYTGFFLLSPVINIYFVEMLRLGSGWIGVLTSAFLLAYVLGSRFWGQVSDRIGNEVVAIACMGLLGAQAAIYAAGTSLGYLIFVQSLGGFSFAGIIVSTFNLLITVGAPAERVRYIAWFNATAGLAGFAGPLIGAWLLGWGGLGAAFGAAVVLRWLGGLAMLGKGRRRTVRRARRLPAQLTRWRRMRELIREKARATM